MIDVKELWMDGGYGKDNPLERSIAYIRKIGVENKIPGRAVDAVLSKTFIGLYNGDKYSLDKCPCGCGIDKSGTAITHHMAKKVLEIGSKIQLEVANRIQSELNTTIEKHFKDNKMKPTRPFMDWDRSEFNRLRKWAFKRK
jgi:hypothetical protein